MTGIYKITNMINGKSYIGQSIHIEQRWEEHLYKSSGCSLIKYALHKYGKENFDFSIIEECQQTKLNEREQYWIQFYDSFNSGYNLTLGGGGAVKYSIEAIYEEFCKTNSIEKTAKNIGCATSTARRVLKEYGINLHEQSDAKPVECIDVNTLKVVNRFLSIEEAAQTLGVSHAAITMALNGTHKTSAGFYWQYAGENRNFISGEKQKQWKTKVQQIDKNTDIILNEFESAAAAADYLGKDRKNGGSQITAVCTGRKKTAYGYKWKKV